MSTVNRAGVREAAARIVLGRAIVDAQPVLDRSDREPNAADIRIQAHLNEQATKTRHSFYLFLVSLLVLLGVVAWVLTSAASPVSQAAAALTVGITGSMFGAWWSERSASKAQFQRIATFGDIFLESPATLNAVLNPEKVDEFIKNLLIAVLGDQALGVSVWNDVVGRMVDDIANDRFRSEMRYEIALRDLEADLAIPKTDIVFAAEEYRLIETRLSYLRRVGALGDSVDVGLILDPIKGLNWFRRPQVFEREYLDVESEVKENLRRAERAASESGLGRLFDRAIALARATGQQRRAAAITALANPTITVGSHELELKQTASHPEGIALHFPIPSPVLRELGNDTAVRITAELALPILKTRDTFPFVLPELTRGITVRFNCRHAVDVTDLQGEILVSGGEPFAYPETAAPPTSLNFASSPRGWILPGSGIIFRWRND